MKGGEREAGRRGHGDGIVAPVFFLCATVKKEGDFAITPPAPFKYLQRGPTATFSDLKGALNHFVKSCKNSYSLPMSYRSHTKIGVQE